MSRPRPEDILLTVPHNWSWDAKAGTTLREWMESGPGPRPGIQPVAARHAVTGQRLSLWVAVPLRYRNTGLSRLLIRLGLLRNPWPPKP